MEPAERAQLTSLRASECNCRMLVKYSERGERVTRSFKQGLEIVSSMSVPKNVLWFEILLYAALALDALSVVFQDHTSSFELIITSTTMAAVLILLQFYFVWLAAQRRVGWPRWGLVAILLLSLISLAQVLSADAIRLGSAIEIVSCMLTAVGLYLSYTGDAQGW